MARVSPDEYAQKWGRRLKASTPDISAGIDKVTTAPGVKAAAQQDLMRTKINESIDNGRWANNVKKVTLSEWQSAAKTKGVARISAGVDGAMPSQAAMAQKLLANVDAAVREVEKTPRGDLQANVQRMVTFAVTMAGSKIK